MNKFLRPLGALAGYLAAALNVIAFVWYGWVTLRGGATTNPVSWWLWFGETLIGLLIYADRTRDMSKWLIEATAMVGVTLVSLYLLVKVFTGSAATVLAPIEPIDMFAVVFAIGTFIFWLASRKRLGAGPALWVFQVVLLMVAFPLIRATHVNPSAEPFGPWALWTLAFAFQTLCAWWRWDGFEPLLNPVNYTITHGLVTLVIYWGTAS